MAGSKSSFGPADSNRCMQDRLISITYLRAFSALLIFCCHVAFIAGAFETSMWLNSGVPMFFIISAYLMSLKEDISSSRKSFYRRRLHSIFPAYWIYLASVVFVLFVIGRAPDIMSIATFGLGLSGLTDGNILGLGHLWFITVLLICYLLTPLLHHICHVYSKRYRIVALSVLCVAQFTLFILLKHPSYGIHVGSYIFVYCFYRLNGKDVSRMQTFVWACMALLFVAARIGLDGLASRYYYYDALFQPVARFVIAMALFAIFVYNSRWIESRASMTPCVHAAVSKFSDISYEVYLTHQFILLAFWEFIPVFHHGAGLFFWIVISLLATVANSFLLAYCKRKSERIIRYNYKHIS